MSLIYKNQSISRDNDFDTFFLKEIEKKRLFKDLICKTDFSCLFNSDHTKMSAFKHFHHINVTEESRIWVVECSHPFFPYFFVIYSDGWFHVYRFEDTSVKKIISNYRTFSTLLNKHDSIVGSVGKCHAKTIQRMFKYFETYKLF